MTREDFTKTLEGVVRQFIDYPADFGPDPQLRINPLTLAVTIVRASDRLAEIEDSNEAVEDAAGAQGAASEDGTDFQVTQNPDFYPLNRLISWGESPSPDHKAIASLVDTYFRNR